MSRADANPGEETIERGSAPLRIGRRDPARLVFDWPDGTASAGSAAALRRGCPCALCVDERTGAPLLDPKSVPDDLTQTHVELIGNYALAITFGDGHRTGIFTWRALRGLTQA